MTKINKITAKREIPQNREIVISKRLSQDAAKPPRRHLGGQKPQFYDGKTRKLENDQFMQKYKS